MYIKKIVVENFKCYKEKFQLSFTEGVNILVGNNEEGKSTILEALHICLSGLYNGRYLRNELSEYLFNSERIGEFKLKPESPPEILIELYFEGDNLAVFEGDANSERTKHSGISLRIAVNESEIELYKEYIKSCKEEISFPIEYYEASWMTFAREIITTKHLPIKSALIDSSNHTFHNGSDIYINHIIKTHLETEEKNKLSQSHRKLQNKFMQEDSVKAVNKKIENLTSSFSSQTPLTLSIDLSSKNVWENSMMSYLKDIPFQQIGKGQQAIIKTKLALEHKKVKEANVILLEEPENHLSHVKLNQLISDISKKCAETKKQIIITTHNSFVANKLGLNHLIFLNDKKSITIKSLSLDTINYFKKISGYDTLRLILSDSAILCEGDSDELIIQKCYHELHGKLPIENGIDVISVGLSFSRYIEIAELLNKNIAIVTDNDGKSERLKNVYQKYTGESKKSIRVFFDDDDGYPTLEPQLIKCNGWSKINDILNIKYLKDFQEHKAGENKFQSEVELLEYMKENKTTCALKIFESTTKISYPKYISDAISFISQK